MRCQDSRQRDAETHGIVRPRLQKREFDLFRALIAEHCGIKLSEQKQMMLQNRIYRRLKALGYSCFKAYYEYVTSPHGQRHEMVQLWSAITINETHFFREPHHFAALTGYVLPRLKARRGNTRMIRVWSAGCSTGQEVYTLAMILEEFIKHHPQWNYRILGTDIDLNVLATARGGSYPMELRHEIPRKYLLRHVECQGAQLHIKEHIKKRVQFAQLNLCRPTRRCQRFDIIFCRNVIMYFHKSVKQDIVQHYYRSLLDDGSFFLGSSESLCGITHEFAIKKSHKSMFYMKEGRL